MTARPRPNRHAESHLPTGSDPLDLRGFNHDIGFYTIAPVGGNPAPLGGSGFLFDLTFDGAHAGVDLLDLATVGTAFPTVKTAGLYVFQSRVLFSAASGSFSAGEWAELQLGTQNEPAPANFWAQLDIDQVDLSSAVGGNPFNPRGSVQLTRWIDPGVLTGGLPNYLTLGVVRNITAVGISADNGEFVVHRLY